MSFSSLLLLSVLSRIARVLFFFPYFIFQIFSILNFTINIEFTMFLGYSIFIYFHFFTSAYALYIYIYMTCIYISGCPACGSGRASVSRVPWWSAAAVISRKPNPSIQNRHSIQKPALKSDTQSQNQTGA